MSIRLVATDLDGTLLLPDASVSPRVAAAVARAQAADIDVVIMTARNWRSVRAIAEAAGVSGLAVCSNGAVIYDLRRGEVAHANTFERDVLGHFVAECRRVAGVVFGWETASGAYRTPEYHALASEDVNYAAVYLRAVEIVDEFHPPNGVTKLLIRRAGSEPAELMAELTSLGHPVTITVSGGPFVEVTAQGVTKAHALEMLCHARGITAADVVAIGDQVNDVPMLVWAGRGVAMGNAHPDVLAATSERTATNLDDGVALVIEGLLAEGRHTCTVGR